VDPEWRVTSLLPPPQSVLLLKSIADMTTRSRLRDLSARQPPADAPRPCAAGGRCRIDETEGSNRGSERDIAHRLFLGDPDRTLEWADSAVGTAQDPESLPAAKAQAGAR